MPREGLDVVALASKHGIELPVDQVADWTKILQSIDENAKTVSEMSDYLPALDLERYPRTEGVTPDDASTGWALKVVLWRLDTRTFESRFIADET